MLRDGFTDGKVENAFSVSFDYFFMGNLSGPYFGSGFQFGNYSVGHENTSERGDWETIEFTASFGYKLNLLPNIHLDSRLAVDALLFGEEEILVDNNRFEPDVGSVYALIGFGIHF